MIRVNTHDGVMFIPEQAIESVYVKTDSDAHHWEVSIALQSGNNVVYDTYNDPQEALDSILRSLRLIDGASGEYVVIDGIIGWDRSNE